MTAQKRNRRSCVEDRWTKTVWDADGNAQTVPSANDGIGKRWRARYVDERGREHVQGFARKVDAKLWLDKQTSAIVSGTHVAPRDAQLTVEQWCNLWIEGYKVNRESTVRQARTHIRQIVAEFGGMPLSALRPSQVKAWTAKLRADGMEASYVYALHSRLSQILSDAVHDGVLGRNPCSRPTSPPMGKPKLYVISTEQVWAIHDAVPDHLQVAVLLGCVRRATGGRGRRTTGIRRGFHQGRRTPQTAVADWAAEDSRQRAADSDSAGLGAAAVGVGPEVPQRDDGHQWAGD